MQSSNLRDSGIAEKCLARLIAVPTQSEVAGKEDTLRAYQCDTIAPFLKEIDFQNGNFGNPVNGANPF